MRANVHERRAAADVRWAKHGPGMPSLTRAYARVFRPDGSVRPLYWTDRAHVRNVLALRGVIVQKPSRRTGGVLGNRHDRRTAATTARLENNRVARNARRRAAQQAARRAKAAKKAAQQVRPYAMSDTDPYPGSY